MAVKNIKINGSSTPINDARIPPLADNSGKMLKVKGDESGMEWSGDLQDVSEVASASLNELNLRINAMGTPAKIGELEDVTEVTAAALNKLDLRATALESQVRGGDKLEAMQIEATRELIAPNLSIDFTDLGTKTTSVDIEFLSNWRNYMSLTTAGNITVNVKVDTETINENYVLVKNTSENLITVSVGTVNGSSSNILVPDEAITVPASSYTEISYVVTPTLTIITASSPLVLKS